MAEDYIRGAGRAKQYQLGTSSGAGDSGPYIGVVKNNIDNTRSGRLQVYIEQFAGPRQDDPSNWRTVNYLPPFYGSTNNLGSGAGTGQFILNKHSYGMWFTPPDLETKVLCFFVAGKAGQGYYVGCIPDDSLTHMVPAVGASDKFKVNNEKLQPFVKDAKQLPVVEINNRDRTINDNPRFYEQEKPIHSVLTGVLHQQGLITDTIRGPITSSSHRESPSNVFGFSTPGRPIYRSGIQDDTVEAAARNLGDNKTAFEVIGRSGGHSIVMDDGDVKGKDNLIRIRTAKGHQITMSDDGNAFYFIHANGQTWIEMGKEGTIDMYSTNSVNVRTNGSMNLHADRDINMFAGNKINMMSNIATTIESEGAVGLRSQQETKVYSKNFVGILGDQTLALKGGTGSFDGGDKLDLKAGCIGLNSGGTVPVQAVPAIRKNKVADVTYTDQGWKQEYGKLQTIANRVPTHEPWPFHGLGIENSVDYDAKSEKRELPKDLKTNLALAKAFVPNNTIQTSDFAVSDKPTILAVGSVDQDEIRGMLAQAVKDVGQNLGDFSVGKGVGKYGLSIENLELAGYIKPGVSKRFLSSPTESVLESVLKSTNSWTGKNGADSIGEFTKSAELQAKVQEDLYVNTLSKLKGSGLVRGTENANDLGPLLQAGAKHGADKVIEWAKGGTPMGVDGESITTAINSTVKNAEYAINFVNEKLKIDTKVFSAPGNFSNTTSRKTLDKDVDNIINDPKIQKPKYTDV